METAREPARGSRQPPTDVKYSVSAAGESASGCMRHDGNKYRKKVIPILNKLEDRSFVIEVWKGHEHGGKGFRYFLDKLIENGLLVK